MTDSVANISVHNVDLTVPGTNKGFTGLLDDNVAMILQWVILGVICQMIDMLGVGANIVNIICFIKQGFKDPVNVSLLALSISDLGCVATMIWANLCLTPAFSAADLPFEPTEIQYLTSIMPHTTFTRVTSWITALITLERCLCITMPLKVKQLVTTKRVSIVVTCVSVTLLLSTAPVYVVNRLGLKFYPSRNKSLVGLLFTENKEFVETISFAINNISVNFGAFVVIITCTVVLVVKLKQNIEWRKQIMYSKQKQNVSSRSQGVARMVVMISTLFIACFIPVSFIFVAMSLEPELTIHGRYRNMLIFIGGLGTILESLNSSVNIFIYYHMSSKYRASFRHLFKLHVD